MFLESARDLLAAHDRAITAMSSVGRRFALGIATHVGGAELPTLLARLNAHDPALTIEVRLDDSCDLMDAFDRGDIDAAIIRRDDDRRDGEVLAPDHFGWFATPDFVRRAGEPLRLAASSPSCGVLDMATRALDAAKIPWRRLSSAADRLPLLRRFRRDSPPRCSLAGWRRRALSRSVSALACPPFPHHRSCCFQRSRMQDPALH